VGFGTMTVLCPTCNGKGSVPCRRCRGKGRLRCPDCGGRGRIKGGCPLCGGTGKMECPACLGTGLRRPSEYRWGPYRVFPALEEGEKPGAGKVLAFQARYRGALVTLAPERAVYGGRLSAYLERKLGEGYGVLLLCVDNSAGNEVIRLTGGKFLRLVSPGADQVEMVDPARIRRRLEEAGSDERLLEAVTPGDVMPGAVRNLVCFFREGITTGLGYRAFFGGGEVVEMDPVVAPAAEMRRLEGAVRRPLAKSVR